MKSAVETKSFVTLMNIDRNRIGVWPSIKDTVEQWKAVESRKRVIAIREPWSMFGRQINLTLTQQPALSAGTK